METKPSKASTSTYTPWRHTSELAMVRGWFYPSYSTPDPYSAPPPDMRQTAVQHVQMWSFKDPRLPQAIIATANLTDAMLHDTLDRRKLISEWALQSVYAMAFCRFVNGFVDRDIAKAALRATAATRPEGAEGAKAGIENEASASTTTTTRGESSMYAHAAAIGMPEQFVDLRHRAIHEEMPSLDVLRQMARRGLEWLWERWWKVRATDDPSRALGEREERRLRGERKAEARRLNGKHADLTDGAVTVNESARAGDHGQERVEVVHDADRDDATRMWLRDGKRKRDLYNADLNTHMRDNGRNAKRMEKLPKVKLKPWTKPAFGLFEP